MYTLCILILQFMINISQYINLICVYDGLLQECSWPINHFNCIINVFIDFINNSRLFRDRLNTQKKSLNRLMNITNIWFIWDKTQTLRSRLYFRETCVGWEKLRYCKDIEKYNFLNFSYEIFRRHPKTNKETVLFYDLVVLLVAHFPPFHTLL